MKRLSHPIRTLLAMLLTLIATALGIHAAERFPTPDFETGYTLPATSVPAPRAALLEALDVSLLFVALSLAAFFALKTRSRRALALLLWACLVYFGFWKKGCVCPVGAWQNVLQAATNPTVSVAPSVLLFFALPLVFALFFGRVFCGSVCPLGAIQDVVVLHPKRLPTWLLHALGTLPYLYLGIAALLVYTDTAFLVCRYDFFVGFFRLNGDFWILMTGAAILLLGIFIARPYCRFLCPYGVLLGWASMLSWRKISITPDNCVQCRLCENACPFDAIAPPSTATEPRRTALKRFAGILLLAPLLIAAGAWATPHLTRPLQHLDRRVQLVTQLEREAAFPEITSTDQTDAFRASGITLSELHQNVAALRNRFRTGSRVLGGCLGLLLACKFAALAIERERTDYEPRRTTCLACGRCYAACPIPKPTHPTTGA